MDATAAGLRQIRRAIRIDRLLYVPLIEKRIQRKESVNNHKMPDPKLRWDHFFWCVGVLVGTLLLTGTHWTKTFAQPMLEKVGVRSAEIHCDPPIYYGIQHCTDSTGVIHTVAIDLLDPHVSFQTVLPLNRNGVECNSVNPSTKDPDSNCPDPYPLEPVAEMLQRYREQGAVAAINTDYFGCSGERACGGPIAYHGAQGLAVRNGVRLDGHGHGDHDENQVKEPSLSISSDNRPSIQIPESDAEIEAQLASTYFNVVGGSPVIVREGLPIGNQGCEESHTGYVVSGHCTKPAQSAIGITSDRYLVLATGAQDATGLAQYLVDQHRVQTALKLDGGGSSLLTWVAGDGTIHSYSPTGGRRPVAEGLLVFSKPIPGKEAISAVPLPALIDTDREINGFGIGSSTHIRLGIEGLPAALDAQQVMGVHWTREEIPWADVEPAFGQFRWRYTKDDGNTRDFDHLLSELALRKIEMVALLTYGPNYDPKLTPYSLLELWRGYVQRVVDKYGDQIDYWEIGNEMNSPEFWGKVVNYSDAPPVPPAVPDPQFYAEMLRVANEIIKAHDPSDTVILGGLVGYIDDQCRHNPFNYLSRLAQLGAWNSFDVIGYHPYWDNHSPETVLSRGPLHDPVSGVCYPGTTAEYKLIDQVRAVRELAVQLGPKPIWITEIGWSREQLAELAGYRGTEPELVQADYLVRTYVPLLAEKGVDTVMWYAQVDDPADQSGQFRLDLQGQRALANLSSLLTGSRPVAQVRGQQDVNLASDDVYEYRFEKSQQIIVVLWKARGGDDPRSVSIENLEGNTVQVYASDTTSLSNTDGKELAVSNGSVTVDLTEHPLFIVATRQAGWQKFVLDLQNRFRQWWAERQREASDWWDETQDAPITWLEGQQQRLSDWFDQQMVSLQRQLETWLAEMERQFVEELDARLDEFFQGLCGTALLPGVIALIVAQRKQDKGDQQGR